MKKVISFLLVLVIALSLCACGASAQLENNVIGKWEISQGYLTLADEMTIEFYKGGVAKSDIKDSGSWCSYTWTIEEDVLKLQGTHSAYAFTLEINNSEQKLVSTDGKVVLIKTNH